MNETAKNCAGCKWLDEYPKIPAGRKGKEDGNGYCAKVTESKSYRLGDRARYSDKKRCELYEAGDFENRHKKGD